MQVFERENGCYLKTLITVGLLKIKVSSSTYVDGCLKQSCISFGPPVGDDNTFGILSVNIWKAPHTKLLLSECACLREQGGCEQLGE